MCSTDISINQSKWNLYGANPCIYIWTPQKCHSKGFHQDGLTTSRVFALGPNRTSDGIHSREILRVLFKSMWMNRKNVHAYCWKAVKVFSRFSAAPATQKEHWVSISIDCCLPFHTQAITEVINASPGKRNYSTHWCIVWQKAWGHPHVWKIYHNVFLSLIHECTTNLAPFVSDERPSKRNNSDFELSSDTGNQ